MSADDRTHPHTGQVVTVFRNRLRESARESYAAELEVVTSLASAMPGFIETKTFVAEDGERATIVTFADPDTHGAWRDHPQHREAMRHGVSDYYDEYSIAVGTTSYASAFTHGTTERVLNWEGSISEFWISVKRAGVFPANALKPAGTTLEKAIKGVA